MTQPAALFGLHDMDHNIKNIHEIDVIEPKHKEVIHRQARSVAMLTHKSYFNFANGKYILNNNAQTFAQAYNLAPGIPFSPEYALLGGTGFLVAPNLFLTAGHCVANEDNTLNSKKVNDRFVVFNHSLQRAGHIKTTLKSKFVYQIKEVVAHYYVEEPAPEQHHQDWALVRLDRDVVGAEPMELSFAEPTIGSNIHCIGHPCGLPKKYTRGGRIVEETTPLDGTAHEMSLKIDSFGGNSGSPVIDDATQKAIGIFIRGLKDFKPMVGYQGPGPKPRVPTVYLDKKETQVGQKLSTLPFVENYLKAKNNDKEGQYKTALYFKDSDPKKAFKWFLRAAIQNHADAMWYVSWRYWKGTGVDVNREESIEWFDKYIEQGCAFYNAENYAKAIEVFGEGVKHNHPKAQQMLGRCYYFGYGVKVNNKKAFQLFEKAANQGDDFGFYYLGLCCLKGYGVKKDESRAFINFANSASKGNPYAHTKMGNFYRYHDLSKKGPGKPDPHVAFIFYREAAERNVVEAQYELAEYYLYGYNPAEKDVDKGIELYKKAAASNHVEAQIALGLYYEKQKNYKEAYLWFRQVAAHKTHPFSVTALAKMTKYSPTCEVACENAAKTTARGITLLFGPIDG